MPGAIVLGSIFVVTMIEMVFSPAQHVCGGNEGVAAVSRVKEAEKESNQPPTQVTRQRTFSESSRTVREFGPLRGNPASAVPSRDIVRVHRNLVLLSLSVQIMKPQRKTANMKKNALLKMIPSVTTITMY